MNDTTEQNSQDENAERDSAICNGFAIAALNLEIDTLPMICITEEHEFDLSESGMDRDCVYNVNLGPSSEGADDNVDMFWFYDWTLEEESGVASDDWWVPITVKWTPNAESNEFQIFELGTSIIEDAEVREAFIDLCYSLGENLIEILDADKK